MRNKNQRGLFEKISDLCYKASEEIEETEETIEILNTCDRLQWLIDEYLGID